VAAPVFAQSPYAGTISITTPGAVFTPGGGCQGQDANVIHCDQLDDLFYIDVELYLSDDPKGMSAFGVTLAGCDGLCYAQMLKGAGQVLNYCGYYSYLSPRAGQPDSGWAMSTVVAYRIAAGCLPMAGPPLDEIGTANAGEGLGYPVPWGQDGLAAWLQADKSTLNCDECCCITAGADVGTTAYIGDSEFRNVDQLTIIPLCIIPEPASLLLLLGALPFLFRRR
jgi:hypothetical protein